NILPANSKLVHVPIKLNDLQYLESIKAQAGFIASLFGVPSHMVTGETPKYSTFEQSLADFKQNTIANITTHYEAQLEAKLLRSVERKAGTTVEFDFSAM